MPPAVSRLLAGRHVDRPLTIGRLKRHIGGSRGFSLVELLIALMIVTLLIGLLLPAIYYSRETARRLTCQGHLRQIGIGLHGYEATFGTLPSGKTKASVPSGGVCDEDEIEVEDHPGACTEFQSWTVVTLPFLEKATLADRYDLGKAWSSVVNRPAVKTPVAVFQCPSALGDEMVDQYHVVGAAATDFGAIDEVEPGVFVDVLGIRDPGHRARQGALAECDVASRRILDGRSYTIMIAESAGKPIAYIDGRRMTQQQFSLVAEQAEELVSVGPHIVAGEGTGWADPDAALDIEGVMVGGIKSLGPRMINATNIGEASSFHPGGAHFLFADGSSSWLADSIDTWAFVTLCTRAGGEINQRR